ncbi:16S rRNA (guanine(527)-N(7))-methyltransferase RsmG [Mycoplasma sp. ES3157-GEN-MYC]|nr:16S rRNA (guanine(527)-N(7))-methyltransferase RsmG [Mycoplasma miroungigenitalium]
MMNEKLEKFAELIFEYNQTKNITGFKTINDIKVNGIADSIQALDVAKELGFQYNSAKIADIGAGAGFPSLPHLLLNCNYELTIIEGMKSRCNFLNNVKEKLDVSNLQIINKRCEDTKELSALFDLVTARAVSSIKNMYMLTNHLLKIGGLLYLLKGRNYQSEIDEFLDNFPEESQNITVKKYKNKLDDDSYIVVITKVKNTPKNWPLSWKQIKEF